MTVPDFKSFYRACTGYDPFPWQVRAAERMKDGNPPSIVAVPTGLGKTGLIVAWVWALAQMEPGSQERKVPLRLVHVSPRRVIVDQTSDLIDRIVEVLSNPKQIKDRDAQKSADWVADRLRSFTNGEGQPLVSARLRGGVRPEPTWRGRVDQPVAIVATSDLAGSGFLFRHFTSSPSTWPVIAGLLGVDACWMLDEGHLQEPLRLTLQRCREAESKSPLLLPWWLIQMTATPREGEDVLRLDDEDKKDPVVLKRLSVKRYVQLHEGISYNKRGGGRGKNEGGGGNKDKGVEYLFKLAQDAVEKERARAVLVVTDTVERARQCWKELREKAGEVGAKQVLLLHGQQREWDRQETLRCVKKAFSMQESPPDKAPAYFLVATNAIEVGADLSADYLITTACPADSLLQRLGRLGRRADKDEYHCDLVVLDKTPQKQASAAQDQADSAENGKGKKSKTDIDKTAQELYQEATNRTVDKLRELAEKNNQCIVIDTDAANKLNQPNFVTPHAPFMPISANALWALLRTQPAPVDTPDVDALIHGMGNRDDSAYLVWRDDLPKEDKSCWVDLLQTWPLRPHEMLSLPAWALHNWLLGKNAPKRPFLVWEERGRVHLVDPNSNLDNVSIRPGMVVVVPTWYGGHDGYGFCPDAESPVVDLADLTNDHPKGPRLRLRTDCLPQVTDDLNELREMIQDLDITDQDINEKIQDILYKLANNDESDKIIRTAAEELLKSKGIEWELRGEGIAVVARSRTIDDEDELCLTGKIGLDKHGKDVAQRAADMARRVGVPDDYVEAAYRGGLYHDIGKIEKHFQACLNWGGGQTSVMQPLAKSGLPKRKWKQAAYEAGVPKGFRHEAISDVLVSQAFPNFDLIAHLVGSSHGWGRPWYPIISPPGETGTIEITLEEHDVSIQGNPLQEGFPEGRAERFERLNIELGPWSLAWLEATVRLADQAVSAIQER